MSNKTETKIKLGNDGMINKEEVPVFEMPTEIKNIGFKPEGRIIAIDYVPVKEKPKADLDVVNLKLDKYSDDLRKVEVKETTESGLVISTSIQEDKAAKGLVIAVGDQVVGYAPGDIIIYKPIPQATVMVEINGNKIFLMEQYNVLGKYI